MVQEQKATQSGDEASVETDENPGKTETPAADAAADLLDEIDEVLEANAEEFVRGFVQKDGQ